MVQRVGGGDKDVQQWAIFYLVKSERVISELRPEYCKEASQAEAVGKVSQRGGTQAQRPPVCMLSALQHQQAAQRDWEEVNMSQRR